MKPASLRWMVSLVFLFSLFPFQWGGAYAAASNASSSSEQVFTSPSSPVSLEGWFHILWGDPADMQGEGQLLYLLVDEQGRFFYLDLSAVGKPFSDLLLLNGKRVSLLGTVPDILRYLPRNPLLVTDIRPLEDLSWGSQETALAPQALLGHQPYVSILCKFSDVAVEPKNLAYFQGMYANIFPGLDHYWRELSYNQVDLLGSSAVGWFSLPHIRDYYVYDMNSDGDPDADFARLTGDCTAAADDSVYYPDFEGVNMMFNADLDGYSYGGGYTLSLDSVTQNYGATWIAVWGYADISVVEHEMGHSFGLPHSSGMYGETYDNWWDVMSWDRHYWNSDPTYGKTGQHTIAYHKDLLGWLSAGDKYTAPQDNLVHTITLEQLALPQTASYKMAILPVIGSSRFYTLEARNRINAGYDRNIQGFSVIIHEVDPSREIPAQVVDYDNNNYTADAGAMWITDSGIQETFIDASDGISVTVMSTGTTNLTVDIRLGSPFPFTTCASQTQMPLDSCQALLALYNETGGASWDRKDHWLGPEWPCRWFGVSCLEMFGDVVSLFDGFLYMDVSNYGNHLVGALPNEIGDLTSLKILNLRNNELTGNIPSEFEELSSLEYLDLGGNQLSGNIPAWLGGLSNLKYLNLDRNQFDGSIPLELGNLSELRGLSLLENQLSGNIPSELGGLSKLEYLDLGHNQLSGNIPASLGNLTNIVYGLFLNSNNLTGNIPPGLGNLTNNSYLNLAWNQLSGIIPPELGQMTSLQQLSLQGNQLSDSLPTELGSLANLYLFYAYMNDLSGSIPSSFGSLANLTSLILWDNHLTGGLPVELFDLPHLQYLELSRNALSGPLPSNIGNLPLYRLTLENNQFMGEIPASITNLTSLYNLDLGNNGLQSSNAAVISFLSSKDSDWAQTQTIAPINLQAAQQGADVHLTWTPILYTGDGGNYEISVAPALSGPFSVLGSTASKSASEFLSSGLGSGSYFFRLRTFTPQHYNQQSDLWSPYTASVPYQAWAIFMPISIR